jgi:phosphoribosylformylglycinamidine cyclo-ligase
LAGITYREAGVNIAEGEKVIRNIREMVRSTHSKNVLTDLGGFGGMFAFDKDLYEEPVLVASTDGVGTKLKLAFLLDKHDTVGEDLVNHCVNDIAVGGAIPLFFLDYYATDKLQSNVFNDVITGFVRGCRNNHCALIGGETAEMPDMYQPGEYDISGTIVGVVERKNAIDGKKIGRSDKLIGLKSNGLHTNGYSLARKVLFTKYHVSEFVDELGSTIGDELLRIHTSYLSVIQNSLATFDIHGISHITGGGIVGNTKRLLHKDLSMRIDWNAWTVPPIFELIKKTGRVPTEDMRQTFNLGIGLIFVVGKTSAADFYDHLIKNNYDAYLVGEVI